MLRKFARRRTFGWLVLAGLLIAVGIGLLKVALNRDFLVHHLSMLEGLGILVFVLGHILMAVLGLPGTALAIAGGAVFGLVWGTVWSLVGATLGAIAAFWLARHLLRNWVMRRFGHHPALKRLNQMVHRHGLTCVLTLRFAPISPFSVLNFLLGLTAIPFRPYTVGTLIGIIPGTIAYTWLGVAGHDALTGEGFGALAIALSALALLSALPLLLRRIGCSDK
ncbi:MAG: TVP38/TMEM64 family protein [Synechococcales bacterium]|nr:TVP38/TMEM64 family protein [Synechococcales bacterium]